MSYNQQLRSVFSTHRSRPELQQVTTTKQRVRRKRYHALINGTHRATLFSEASTWSFLGAQPLGSGYEVFNSKWKIIDKFIPF